MRHIFTLLILFIGFSVNAQITVDYTYDNLNRLTKATYSNGTTITYSYDALGNRTQQIQQAKLISISSSANPSAAGSVIGTGNYNPGSNVALNATANTGYTFTNWTESGSIVSNTNPYSFAATVNRTIVANFTATNYTISTISNPSNGGTTTGGGSYGYNTSVTVKATPNSGYSFSNWTENGGVVSTNATYTFTISGNRNLVANFTKNQTNYTVSTSSNPSAGGSTTGGGTYSSGTSVTLKASANSGYSFSNWTENGSVVSTNATFTFTVSANRNLVANFTKNQTNYTVSTISNPTAGGSTTGEGSYSSGTSLTVKAIANSGYSFSNWTENGGVASTSATYTFTVSGNRTLVANFSSSTMNIVSFSPTSAQSGDIIVIKGNGFDNVTSVSFGGVLASGFTVQSRTQLSAVVASGASGKVVVKTKDSEASLDGFTYVFGLPASNFKVSSVAVSCIGSSDGKIMVEATQGKKYVAVITGKTVNSSYQFNDRLDVPSLSAGKYQICITIQGQSDYKQCFEVTVSQPKDLSVYIAMAPPEKSITLHLDGGQTYYIRLGQNSYSTTESSITLPLENNSQTLVVTTDLLCQGEYRKEISIGDVGVVYPNPFTNYLEVSLGNLSSATMTVKLTHVSTGQVYYFKKVDVQSGRLSVNTMDIPKGVYALIVSNEKINYVFKIIKVEN